MEHLTVPANGAAFHVARAGKGPPLLLLHGWPEFWLTWEPVMALLADRYTVFAPDLRGFGDSDKPTGPFGPDQHAADMLALMDALDLNQVGVVGHDIGGALMQPLARRAPQRMAGLFFFDFIYPGIGPRMAEPDRLNNIWYQSSTSWRWRRPWSARRAKAAGLISDTFSRRWHTARMHSMTCSKPSRIIF
jgi:pimeloyl-ACP methyl ester carboxylesterase